MPRSLWPRRAAASASLLERIAANVAAVGARDRETVEAEPFRAFLSPSSPDYLMSFAVPTATPPDWAPAIAALNRIFEARGRRLRLEFLEEPYPGLGPALEAAGIGHRTSQPAMVLAPAALRPRPLARAAEYRRLGPDSPALLDGLIEVQQCSFNLPLDVTGDSQWRAFLGRGLEDGSVMAAVIRIDGQAMCAAGLQIGGGAAELSGVATRPGYRRRGLASALCSRLLREFFAAGHDLAWLSAADPVSGAIYRRLGFRPVGTQLNYGVGPEDRADPSGRT